MRKAVVSHQRAVTGRVVVVRDLIRITIIKDIPDILSLLLVERNTNNTPQIKETGNKYSKYGFNKNPNQPIIALIKPSK
jgi:hypothetical protein